jgi:hypothetical protein
VLARLAQAETRIELLESKSASSLPDLSISRTDYSSVHLSADGSRMPDLHTAAGHKILQYWPRLRVKLTLPGIEPFTFLKAADREDTFLTGLILGAEQEFELLPTIQSLEAFYENLLDLPLSLVDLLETSAYFSKEHILEPLYERSRLNQSIFNLRECSIESLLMQTIAVGHVPTRPAISSHRSRETFFKMALDSFWKLNSESDEYTIPLTLCFSQILLYFFARPFHALGILQGLKPAIDRFEKTRLGDE